MTDHASLPSLTDTEQQLKTPPHSLEAEQSVVGGLMLEGEHVDEVMAIVQPEDFYIQAHRTLFEAIIALRQDNRPYDAISVIDYLSGVRRLEEVGGKSFIAELLRNVPTAANLQYYARIVRDKSILRQLIQASHEIIELAYFPQGKSIRDVLDVVETRILKIAEHGQDRERDYQEIRELLGKVLDRIDELYRSSSPITGLETFYTDLDEKTAGLQPGDLIIVAGRPSMGKTTFSMNIAENVAIKGGKPVAVFSLEMPGEQLVTRMLSSVGRIPSQRLRTGKLKEEDWPKLTNALKMLSETQIYIDDTPALSINELRARARRIDKALRDQQREAARQAGKSEEEVEKAATGLSLLVIDYLQLMRGSSTVENRVNEISEISRGLKALAKELNIPVIALSQLNRSLEQRPDKRPKMSDLRESGAIEQDADLIMFIYRDEVYNPDTDAKGMAEVIIGKHRNGPTGKIVLTFMGEFTRFENFAPQDNTLPEAF